MSPNNSAKPFAPLYGNLEQKYLKACILHHTTKKCLNRVFHRTSTMTKTIKFTGKKDPRTALLYCFIIATVTFISFSSSLNDGFTNWDDDKYVTNNPYLRNFSIDNVKNTVAFKYGYYQPLTMLSYLVEFAAFQLHPLGYHLTNILLHCINALLVFALIHGLTGRYKISLLVSLLFALHPLRVETVAWISERKDLLSSLFYFLSLLSYV